MEKSIKTISEWRKKKGVMDQIINIFILVLVISVLSGMTFLFVSQLKENIKDTTATTAGLVSNESGWLNASGYRVVKGTRVGFRSFSIVEIYNATGSMIIPVANYTYDQDGMVYNATAGVGLTHFEDVNITYTFVSIGDDDLNAYLAINTTETAGYNITKYLTILFLALIFGAILVVVLRVILPYINVGQQMGGF